MSDTAAKSPLAPTAVARTNTTPPGWANDELTKFLQETHQQQYATFHNKKEAVGRLVTIDELFVRVSKNWLNPPSEVEAMLFVRCHAAFRAAAGEAMAGQAVECYRQCRGMLENAAYAVHIRRDPSLAKVWLNRHQDEAGMGASKKAFQHIAVGASVAAANQHAGMRFEELYQRTIDWGAQEPDRRVMLAILLHGDGVELDMALKTAAQCGMVSLEMLQILYNAKFELLGINAAMLDLRKFASRSDRLRSYRPPRQRRLRHSAFCTSGACDAKSAISFSRSLSARARPIRAASRSDREPLQSVFTQPGSAATNSRSPRCG